MSTHAKTCREEAPKTETRLPAAILLVAIALLAGARPSFAQSSATSIGFQGPLNGADGQPLPNGNHTPTFEFWDHPTSTAVSNRQLCPVPLRNQPGAFFFDYCSWTRGRLQPRCLQVQR